MGATYALIAKSKSFTGSAQFLRGSHDLGFAKFLSWRDGTRAQHDCKGAKARGARLRELGVQGFHFDRGEMSRDHRIDSDEI